jgi:tetratricopeptide (TPR) repeat protein
MIRQSYTYSIQFLFFKKLTVITVGTAIGVFVGLVNKFFCIFGVTNLRLGFYEESIKSFNQVISHNPVSPTAYALLGGAYVNIDMKFEARQAFAKALELDPDDKKAGHGLDMLDDFKGINF